MTYHFLIKKNIVEILIILIYTKRRLFQIINKHKNSKIIILNLMDHSK